MEGNKENVYPRIDIPYLCLLARRNRVPLQEYRHQEHLENDQIYTEDQMENVLDGLLTRRVGRMAWNNFSSTVRETLFEDDNLQLALEYIEGADQDTIDDYWALGEVHRQVDERLLEIEQNELNAIWTNILNERTGQRADVPRDVAWDNMSDGVGGGLAEHQIRGGEQPLVQEQPAEGEQDEMEVPDDTEEQLVEDE